MSEENKKIAIAALLGAIVVVVGYVVWDSATAPQRATQDTREGIERINDALGK